MSSKDRMRPKTCEPSERDLNESSKINDNIVSSVQQMIERINSNEKIRRVSKLIEEFNKTHRLFQPFITVFSFVFFYLNTIPKYMYCIFTFTLSVLFYMFNFLFNYIVYYPLVFAYQSVAFIIAIIYYAIVYVSMGVFYFVYYCVSYLIVWPLTSLLQAIIFVASSKLFTYVLVFSIIIGSLFWMYQYFLKDKISFRIKFNKSPKK